MATVLYAKPGIRAEGKKAKWGYIVITDEKVLHVSPKHIYLKILLVGFVPFLVGGQMIARKHALEWAANPPQGSAVVPLTDDVVVKRGHFRMNGKVLALVSSDGQEHVFGVPYKKVQPILSQALAGRPASVEAV